VGSSHTWIWVAALLIALPSNASAQWPVGRGNFWTKVSAFQHQTTEQFRANGEKRPFLNTNADSRAKAVFLDGLVGVTDRLDLWVQVPFFELRFDDIVDERVSTGFGDARLSARYNLVQLRNGSLPISIRYTTKVPLVDFEVDAEVIPVGEGQWDHELWLESGLSLWPLPAYSVLWLGYRWRSMNSETERDPGDELALLAELGGTSLIGGLGAKAVLDGIFGRNGSVQGVRVSNDEREILYLAPTLLYNFSESTILESAIRIPLLGQNFPAGNQFMIAIFHQGRLWG
jgi:hypothetical protein